MVNFDTKGGSQIFDNSSARVWVPQPYLPMFQEFQIGYERVEILGIPIGDIDYINEFVILKLIGAREKLNTIQKFTNDKIKTDMIRKFNGTSKLMYLFSNLDYESNETIYKQELNKFDYDKIMTASTTTLTEIQKQQLELPVADGGIGIGGMQDYISSMVLSLETKICTVFHLT